MKTVCRILEIAIPPISVLTIGFAIVHFYVDKLDKIIPLLWFLLAVYAVWLLRSPLLEAAKRIKNIKVESLGFELELAEGAYEKALSEREVPTNDIKSESTRKRLKSERDRLVGAEILWVDDNPIGNRSEARILQYSGAAVTCAASTDEAIRALADSARIAPFDMIISDMKRGENDQAGIELIGALKDARVSKPLIFYVGSTDGQAPKGSDGITDRPDILIDMILNVLRNRRSVEH